MADLDTIERVKDIDVDKYKYGFTTDIESVKAPKGLNEDIIRFISAEEERAGMDAGVAAGRLSALADDEGADLGEGGVSADRLSGPVLLFRAEVDGGRRASTRSIRNCCAPMKSSVSR